MPTTAPITGTGTVKFEIAAGRIDADGSAKDCRRR